MKKNTVGERLNAKPELSLSSRTPLDLWLSLPLWLGN